jgi:hypothetical protein
MEPNGHFLKNTAFAIFLTKQCSSCGRN